MTQNLLFTVDSTVNAALEIAKADAADALAKYTEARSRVAELEAIRDLRLSLGAQVAVVQVPVRTLRAGNG